MRHRSTIVLLGIAVAALKGCTTAVVVQGFSPATEIPLAVVPLGVSPMVPVPSANPLTPARIALGRRLFFDRRLSIDGSVACASCHRPERAFADDRPLSRGARGRLGRRNVPSLLNRAYARVLFWDGRAMSLEEQALAPMVGDTELANTYDGIVDRIRIDQSYEMAFAAAFGTGEVTRERAAQALAAFQRTLLAGDSAVDRFDFMSDRRALSPAAARGAALFRGKARCHVCHDGPLFSDERFHNTGVSWGRAPVDLGRYEVTRIAADRGAFRTPSLRHVAQTAPYMHDGSLRTLDDVVRFYNAGGRPNPYLDGLVRPLDLTATEQRDLVAFLKALSASSFPVKKPT